MWSRFMAEAIGSVLSLMARKLSKQREAAKLEESCEGRNSSPIDIAPVNDQDKVRKWLSSADSGVFIASEPDFLQDLILSSSSESDGDIFDDRAGLTGLLQAIANESKCLVEQVAWDTSRCDMFVRLGDRLFPVEKQTLVTKSEFFRISLKDSDDAKVIEIDYHKGCFVREALRCIYADRYDVTDDNVPDLLHLSHEFQISDLLRACIDHLRSSTSFNTMVTLSLARKYNISILFDFACRALSKIVKFEKTAEFFALDQSTQIVIMAYIIQRYQRAWNSVDQFDVHLCSYHGDSNVNHECCYRSATYKQENGRTFLVRMETPAKKLSEAFKAAFEK